MFSQQTIPQLDRKIVKITIFPLCLWLICYLPKVHVGLHPNFNVSTTKTVKLVFQCFRETITSTEDYRLCPYTFRRTVSLRISNDILEVTGRNSQKDCQGVLCTRLAPIFQIGRLLFNI